MPAARSAVGIPENLGVVVGVQIDEARCDDEAFSVDVAGCGFL